VRGNLERGKPMVVDVKRKKGETFESFVRRFNKRLMQSGVVLQTKKKAYTKKPVSRNLVKAATLARKDHREKKEYMKKIGKLREETNTRRKRY
jgi:ribosomal protein S21